MILHEANYLLLPQILYLLWRFIVIVSDHLINTNEFKINYFQSNFSNMHGLRTLPLSQRSSIQTLV